MTTGSPPKQYFIVNWTIYYLKKKKFNKFELNTKNLNEKKKKKLTTLQFFICFISSL